VRFIGMRDDGRAEGVANTDKRQKALRKIWEQDCYPPIEPSPQVAVLQVDGVEILAVEVMPSPKRPHFSGPAFVRIGSESVAASRELFEQMLTGHCGKAGTILKLVGQGRDCRAYRADSQRRARSRPQGRDRASSAPIACLPAGSPVSPTRNPEEPT
jgi:Schlafen, AlbA_2